MVSTLTAGRIMMYMDYDSLDPVPESARDFLTNSRAVSAPMWDAKLNYKCSERGLNSSNSKYVRYSAIPEGGAVQWYDVGTAHVAFDNLDASMAGVQTHSVFFDYDIELMVPHTDDLELAVASTYSGLEGTATNSDYFSSMTQVGRSGLPLNFDPLKLTFPLPGFYLIDIDIVGSTSPDASVTPSSQAEVADAGSTVFGTSGISKALNLHCKEAGQSLTFTTVAGNVVSIRLTVVRDASTLAASHVVVSDQPNFKAQRSTIEDGFDVVSSPYTAGSSRVKTHAARINGMNG